MNHLSLKFLTWLLSPQWLYLGIASWNKSPSPLDSFCRAGYFITAAEMKQKHTADPTCPQWYLVDVIYGWGQSVICLFQFKKIALVTVSVWMKTEPGQGNSWDLHPLESVLRCGKETTQAFVWILHTSVETFFSFLPCCDFSRTSKETILLLCFNLFKPIGSLLGEKVCLWWIPKDSFLGKSTVALPVISNDRLPNG